MVTNKIFGILSTLGGVKADRCPDVVQFIESSCEIPAFFDGKDHLKYARECIRKDNGGIFPTVDDYRAAGFPLPSSVERYGSISAINVELPALLGNIALIAFNKTMTKVTNESTDYTEVEDKVRKALDDITSAVTSDVDINIEPILYTKSDVLAEGIKTSIEEIDRLTYGFQRKSIATIAAYTGHGKSTLIESIVYNNARLGKKCLIFSLELPPEHVWAHFEQRYAYESGIDVDKKDVSFRSLNDSTADRVIALQEQFKQEIGNNIAVVDESAFKSSDAMRKVLIDYSCLNKFLEKIAKKLGGLDVVVFDHVNQIELLYPDCGNRAIKAFQSSVKTFVDERGLSPVFIQACQANREGYRYALRNNGKYLPTAVGDLNEVERSSAYLIFLYTDDDDAHSDNTRVTFAKHRFGQRYEDVVNVPFHPEITSVGSGEAIDVSKDVDFSGATFGGGGDFGDPF